MKNTKKSFKVPMRKCTVTQERFPKKELIRVVRTPEGEIVVDPSGRLNGHGAYLKKDPEVFAKAKKNRALSRALEAPIPDSVYEELEAMIHE